MRRNIFSTSNFITTILPVADTGGLYELNTNSVVTVTGSQSYYINGSISSYLWENFNGETYSISSPNSESTVLTGMVDGGIYTIKLTVTDNDGGTHSDVATVTINTFSTPIGGYDLRIISKELSDGTGSVGFLYGDPNEVLQLKFEMYNASTGDESISFSGLNQGNLDTLHLERLGVVTLGADGTFNANYSSTGTGFSCQVEIVSRSGVDPMPSSGVMISADVP
mgnify:CR=1 FL=1|tara:strand:- start:347 stop:1018 length:672 start_codon:yes stop_codon:yes gene_type:complete